jgi:TRAP-type uncharacterized transport system fused permease subunit
VFTLRAEGMGILLQGSLIMILWTSATAAVGVCALAVGAAGWFLTRTTGLERILAIAAGLLLMYPAGITDLAGLGLFAAMVALHLLRRAA